MTMRPRSRILRFICGFFVALTGSFVPAAADSLTLEFFAQEGPLPVRIEIESEAEFRGSFQLSDSTKKVEIPGSAFRRPIETMRAVFSYDDSRIVELDVRLAYPGKAETKGVFLVAPGRFENYARATERSFLLLRDNRKKAFGPYFVCRETFAIAEEKGDRQTQAVAAACWITAIHRLVFADAAQTRRIFAPDPLAVEAITKIIDAYAIGDPVWKDAYDRSILKDHPPSGFKSLVDEINVSQWMFFDDIRAMVSTHLRSAACELADKFREQYGAMTDGERALIADKFGIEGSDVANDGVALASASPVDECGSTEALLEKKRSDRRS